MSRLLFVAMLVAILMAAPAEPVSWTVAGASPVQVKAGGRFTVKLNARIADGWHLYGMKPEPGGPIPTRIWITEGQPLTLAGPIEAAEPRTLHDPSFDMEVGIYERQASFTMPVRIARTAPTGALNMLVNGSYQTCDNKICLPPKTVEVEVPLSVSK